MQNWDHVDSLCSSPFVVIATPPAGGVAISGKPDTECTSNQIRRAGSGPGQPLLPFGQFTFTPARHWQPSSATDFPMLRRPYFFCLYKRNRGKKIQVRGRAFYKAALPLTDPPPPKMASLLGLTVGQGAPRPLPLPKIPCAGSATQICRNRYAVREGYIGEGACLCGSKVLAPPLWAVFLPTLFGQAKRVGPRREREVFCGR